MSWEAVIGIEIHVQLRTATKMFCPCAVPVEGDAPNARTCPTCLGLPGALPVANRAAVEKVLAVGAAIGATSPQTTRWDRKNYFYPDLPKGYQISQLDLPLAEHGQIAVTTSGGPRTVRIRRAHLEEDTARLRHERRADGARASLVDYNRSGIALLEIVTEPDIRDAETARRYAEELRLLLRTIGAADAEMENGQMRVEANVSLRPSSDAPFGVRVEVKNMNSFRSVVRALEFEIARQTEVLNAGGRIVQETRGWVDDKAITVSQRSKEEANDYRYFPEPDLPPVITTAVEVDRIRARLPEMPDAKRARFAADYGVTADVAETLAQSRSLANWFEEVARLSGNPRNAANWVVRDIMRILSATGGEVDSLKIGPGHLAELIRLIDNGTISVRTAPEVLEEAVAHGTMPAEIVQARGLGQVSDTDALAAAVAEAVAANPKAVADYRAGKATAMGFLVGAVMKATRGKGNPGLVNELLKRQLDG